MDYRVEFAGYELHKIVKIEKITTSILPKRNNFNTVIPSENGSYYKGFRYEERVFKMDIALPTKTQKDYETKVKELTNILNVKEPSILKINDENIIYYAVPDGETELAKTLNTGKVQLIFICHDIYGYSEDYSSVIMKNRIFNFTDVGNATTYPILGFKFSKPSSFVYLVNTKSQAIMIGREKNATIPSIQNQELLINDDCTNSSKFTDGGRVVVSDNRLTGGSYGVGNYGEGIVATSYGEDVENKWTGTTFRKNIDVGLEEFEVKVNMSFSSQGENFKPLATRDLVRVARKSGIYMHTDENDKSTIIGLIPYGTDLKIIHMGQYGFCTVKYDKKVGWVDTKYLWRMNIEERADAGNYRGENIFDDLKYAENQMGLIEVLGLDNEGQTLFRFHLRDDNKFFEHVIPEIYIKDKLYLQDNQYLPQPFTINYKDSEGRPLGKKQIASGLFGNWNDYTGTFTMRRRKLEDGKYRWWGQITRTEDGLNITQTIHMGSGIIDDKLPKGKLTHLVFYIAKYCKTEPVSIMSVNHIKVKDIKNENKDKKEEVNLNIFKENDYLEIDFNKCEVTLNGEDFISELDIGSEFFEVEKDDFIVVRSDDENLTGISSYKKRYL